MKISSYQDKYTERWKSISRRFIKLKTKKMHCNANNAPNHLLMRNGCMLMSRETILMYSLIVTDVENDSREQITWRSIKKVYVRNWLKVWLFSDNAFELVFNYRDIKSRFKYHMFALILNMKQIPLRSADSVMTWCTNKKSKIGHCFLFQIKFSNSS